MRMSRDSQHLLHVQQQSVKYTCRRKINGLINIATSFFENYGVSAWTRGWESADILQTRGEGSIFYDFAWTSASNRKFINKRTSIIHPSIIR